MTDERHRNPWRWVLGTLAVLGAAAGAVAVGRHFRVVPSGGHGAPGGVLMRDASGYDRFSRRMLGSFFDSIAADVAHAAPPSARILEIGCGPGHLAMRMAESHGLNVTAIDLDPAMIEQARANASAAAGARSPSFEVGDVASLTHPDGSFDLVVSTASMHHWKDPAAGLREIDRVLAPGGRALIWDVRSGMWPLHRHVPDPAEQARESRLRVVHTTPWRWPWRLSLTRRFELARTDERSVTTTPTEPESGPSTW